MNILPACYKYSLSSFFFCIFLGRKITSIKHHDRDNAMLTKKVDSPYTIVNKGSGQANQKLIHTTTEQISGCFYV